MKAFINFYKNQNFHDIFNYDIHIDMFMKRKVHNAKAHQFRGVND